MAQSAVDIWLAAQTLVDTHGGEAPAIAVMEADTLAEDGDWQGQATWRHIARAAEMLVAARPERAAGGAASGPVERLGHAVVFPAAPRTAGTPAKAASPQPRH